MTAPKTQFTLSKVEKESVAPSMFSDLQLDVDTVQQLTGLPRIELEERFKILQNIDEREVIRQKLREQVERQGPKKVRAEIARAMFTLFKFDVETVHNFFGIPKVELADAYLQPPIGMDEGINSAHRFVMHMYVFSYTVWYICTCIEYEQGLKLKVVQSLSSGRYPDFVALYKSFLIFPLKQTSKILRNRPKQRCSSAGYWAF